MKILRVIAVILSTFVLSAAHAAETDDWATLSRVLSLMQGFLQIQAESQNDPRRMEKHLDGVLSGKNADANKVMDDVFEGMPREQRRQVLGIARQLVVLGRDHAVQTRKQSEENDAIQARKDLAGMGLAYFDQRQFLDAVRRNDVIAVRLFFTGRGVDTRGAREVARSAGLIEMEQLLAEQAAHKP